MSKIKSIQQRIENLVNKKYELEEDFRQKQYKILEQLKVLVETVTKEKFSNKNIDLVMSEFWDCEESPTGFCMYDNNEDPVHDNCLFCGDPEERK